MSSSISSDVTPALIQELLEKHGETLLQGLAKMLQSSAPASAAPSGGKAPKPAKTSKKAKAASEDSADAEPKEKRPPNAWILFSARVEKVVREAEKAAETPKESAMKTVVAKQFASHLKTLKAYDEWTDAEITEAMATWTPPETSKQAIAKAEKEASESGSDAGSVADAPKPKRVMSDEAKAAAAAKRAATLAAKKAASASTEPSADTPAPAAEVAAPAKKTVAIKPKTPAPAKKVDLSFFLWTHEGKEYYTNDRGDVVTTDFEWVGSYDGKAINEAAPEPDDLSEATLRE